MTNDAELLQSYVRQGDEVAFRELVERHLPTVYSAALRQVGGDKHLAEDVTQNVFRDLARNASGFSPNAVVAGWLYRATQFAAAKTVRHEKRRRARETTAALEYETQVGADGEDHSEDWEVLQVHLDGAMNELGERDRDALLLRFFQGLDFHAVGAELNISDDTAQKRVSRALERLRQLLMQRGVTLSITVLGTLIAGRAAATPAEALAATVVAGIKCAIAAGGAAVSGGILAKFGLALLRPKVACGAGLVVTAVILAVLLLNTRPARSVVTYDLSRDFPAVVNATSVWSFGWTPALGGPFTRLGYLKRYRSDNGVPLLAWQVGDTDRPGVGINMSTNTAASAGGAFVGLRGAVWFGPEIGGSVRKFGIIRFTVPPDGKAAYRLNTAVCSLFDGPVSKEIEFHVLKNGTPLFNRLLAPNSNAAYSEVMKLYPGDIIDFVAGRGRNPTDEPSGLKIRATLTTDLTAPGNDLALALAAAPLILSPPRDQKEPVGASAGFEFTAGGSLPRHYQWRFGSSPIPGATNQMLLLSEIGAEHGGQYCVVVSNAVGVVTSSVATLTITTCAPIPSGLACWWSAEGSAGDRFGGQHGKRLAGTTFASGRVGHAFLFQGDEAGVFMPANPGLDIGAGGSFTIEAWIKPATVAGKQPLVGWNSDTDFGVNLSIGNGGLYANVRDEKGNPHRVESRAGSVAADRWQHVAFTYDARSQSARLYRDGRIVADEHTEAFVPNTKLDVQFGRRREGDLVRTYSGLMDEISLYHRALTSHEIAAIASAGGAGKCVSRAHFSKEVTVAPTR